jgi:hypothetical protein
MSRHARLPPVPHLCRSINPNQLHTKGLTVLAFLGPATLRQFVLSEHNHCAEHGCASFGPVQNSCRRNDEPVISTDYFCQPAVSKGLQLQLHFWDRNPKKTERYKKRIKGHRHNPAASSGENGKSGIRASGRAPGL